MIILLLVIFTCKQSLSLIPSACACVCTILSITAVAEFKISPRTCADLVCQTIALLQFLWAFWKCLTTTLSVSRNPHIKRQIVARHELNYNNNNKRKNKTKMAVSCAQRDQKYKNNTKSATNVEIFCVKFNLTYKLMQWCATKRATWKCVWPKQNVEPKMNLQSKHLLPCCCCYCWYFCCFCTPNWCCCCCGGHPLLQHVALSKLLRSKKLLRPLYKAR